MGNTKKYKITIIIFGIIGAASVAALFQEIGVAMSGLMVQFGWCAQNDYACILIHYGLIALLLVAVGIVIDIIRNKKFSKVKKDESFLIVFRRHAFHSTYKIINSKAEDVAKYLRQSLSTNLQYVHLLYFAYDTNPDGVQFYDPQKDGTMQYGIVVPGSRYNIDGRAKIIKRQFGTELKIPELFIISVVTGNQNNNATAIVNFDADIDDVHKFFSVLIESELNKIFNIEILNN
jgi:hypothetical protein